MTATEVTLEASDVGLSAAVAAVVAQPRTRAADSFVLHAPLELLARAALLPFVAATHRDAARERIAAIAATYRNFDDAIAAPARRDFASPIAAAARLADAIDAGDLDEVDATAAWLGDVLDGKALRRLLADTIVPRLAAAAHGPIFLYHLPRVSPRREITATLLRPLARELARYPEWRLSWFEHETARGSNGIAGGLFESLATTPQLGVPGSDFIFPLMSRAENSGVAADVLAGVTTTTDFTTAARDVLRCAAMSMLQEPPTHAPYGWSHCLTMPQAVLGLAEACSEPNHALAVAATYVVGFRAALASGPLSDHYAPDDPGVALDDALDVDGATAAAAVWHAPHEAVDTMVRQLVSYAAAHNDAHLVKYMLACLDAMAFDRTNARLYLSAAASLAAFWKALER